MHLEFFSGNLYVINSTIDPAMLLTQTSLKEPLDVIIHDNLIYCYTNYGIYILDNGLDSDGDGKSDAYEIYISHTDPYSYNIFFSPSSPQNLEANWQNSQIELTWGRPLYDGGDNITQLNISYNIYRSVNLSQPFINIAKTTTLNYNDNNITEENSSAITYSYYVTAVNNYSEGPKTNIIDISYYPNNSTLSSNNTETIQPSTQISIRTVTVSIQQNSSNLSQSQPNIISTTNYDSIYFFLILPIITIKRKFYPKK